ncbi:protein of unknown function [Klenkia soli]|uniref:DUF4037 domain-containing protein n=1 Tax=Klenkia soli TaxID=1052260 RepID=A0A1H0HZI8_9ACTN|nr:DUF4037 domain-containing protein [Klenkia soli]SDO24290.1 protein of unknown function [Klenkia soli]
MSTETQELLRGYVTQVVEPLLQARFPELRYAIGRLGSGSDVLGLDDATSRDHDWGLRLTLLVPDGLPRVVAEELDRALPDSFGGLPTRFATTGSTTVQHQVHVATVPQFLRGGLGFDPLDGIGVTDWLSLSGQAVLEVVAGPVFADRTGEIGAARAALAWYPDDVWCHVLACDWLRIAQELPAVGRAADVGDDLGSRVVTARLVQVLMHLAFLLDQRWAPWAKWFGTAFARLPLAARLAPALDAALRGAGREDRQHALAAALDVLVARHRELGLTDVARAAVPFWDRPHLHPDPAIAAQLLDRVVDPAVRALPTGRGSVEQRTSNVDVLLDPAARRASVAR